MQRFSNRGLIVVLALLSLLVAVNGAVAWRNLAELYEGRLKVEQSRRAQATLHRAQAVLHEAETAVNAYVITADPAYLDAYEQVAAQMDARLDDLARDLSDADQRQLLPPFRQGVAARLAELAAVAAARRQQGFEAARERMLAGEGRAGLDRLQALVDRMGEAEADLLDRRAGASREGLALGQFANLFGAALAIALVLLLVAHLRRNLRERDEAAAALQAQEELFRTTLASLGDAVVACDTNARVTFINPAAAELTGWNPARAVGQQVADVVRIVAPGGGAFPCLAATALAQGAAVPVAHRGPLRPRGGQRDRLVEESAEPVRDMDGRVVGAVLVFRDIAERKRHEDALREADQRKTEFLAVLAHELRNPLAPLRNALQILRVAGHDRATQEHVFGMMDRQVRQMVRLIDDLLDVSRITRNKLELRREPVALAEVVEAAFEMASPTVARYGHRVEVDVPTELPPVDGDRARLVQVVDNLLTNAAKYGEPGGLIRVAATPGREGFLRLTVRDTGAGIPPEMLGRIFEMFTQVDRTLERTRGGLGIGLTLVKRLVELHGGTIVARSEGVGRGSEFEVTLPLAHGPAAAPADAGPEAEPVPPRRVLVCDDNEDAAETLARMLRMQGHDVRLVLGGAACLAACEADPPDVAILDIGMPGLNGYEVARRIRAQPWGSRIVLVALTGFGQAEDRRRAFEAGFDQHLTKPADFTRLAQALRGTPLDREATHA